jgi:hypothetical protein
MPAGAPHLVLERGGLMVDTPLDTAELAPLGRVNETETVGFHIRDAEAGTEYRLLIGTEPAGGDDETAVGGRVGETVQWPDDNYFESARGATPVRVQSRQGDAPWNARGGGLVDTVPGKLGEARYRALHDELRAISPALVRDVHGKSMRAPSARGGDAIAAAWRRAERALTAVDAAVDTHVRARHARGDRRARVLGELLDPARRPELRDIAAALDEVAARVGRITKATDAAIAELDAQRPSADVLVHGRSLYTLRDAPRRERLAALGDALHTLQARVLTVRTGPPFARVVAHAAAPARVVASAPHRHAIVAVRAVLDAVREAEAGGSYLTPTSRLYEEWLFLRLARCVARIAVDAAPLTRFTARLGRRHYGGGLPRDVALRFELPGGRLCVLRFEPWIRPRPEARDAGDDLCREDIAAAPLTPDVLLEVHDGTATRIAIVDAKYTTDPRPGLWRRLERYFAVRRTSTGRRLDAGVWLAAPISVAYDAAARAAVRPPTGWRGGFLPLVPGTTALEPLVPAEGPVVSPSDRSRFGEDGADATVRLLIEKLLED